MVDTVPCVDRNAIVSLFVDGDRPIAAYYMKTFDV